MATKAEAEPLCAFCARARSETGPLVGAGVHICGTCAQSAVDVLSGRPSEATARGGWGLGRVGEAELAAMSPREAFDEAERVRAVIRPLHEFLEDAADAMLQGRTCPHPDVVLPDGTIVRGARFDRSYARDVPPAVGLYLDRVWSPPWPHFHVDWPDFGVPAEPSAFRAALVVLLARARAGARVEVGCLGGHGRTGTALACLAVLAGISAPDAVAWVREHYCAKAVETPGQQEFVAAFA